MRKVLLSTICAASLGLGGCAYGLGGLGGQDVLGSVLGSVIGGQGGYGQGGPDFQSMAVEACGNEASRYGSVRIADVRQADRDTLRVYGTINDNYRQREFGCSYRSDGRITDFDVR